MKWTSEKPTKPGWYWWRNLHYSEENTQRIVELRIYDGEIAIGNSTLRGFTRFETGQWAGPLVPPS